MTKNGDTKATVTVNRKHLTKKDATLAWFKWIALSNCNYNYERLMASALLSSFSHIPEKLYPGDKQKKIEFMQRQMEFYNTEPHFGCIINGLALSMEEEMADNSAVTPEAITAVKTGLMGPFAGIGDTLWQGTLRLIATASTMGAIVLGCLANQYVSLTSYLSIPVGEGAIDLQATLDSILKGGVPLAITILSWYLLKKRNVNSTIVLLILVAIGILLGATGLFGGVAS